MKRILQLRNLNRKKIIIIAILFTVLTAAVVFAVRMWMFRNAKNEMGAMTVQSTQAETGTISTTVTGTGTLASADAEDLIVPVGIKIKKVLVEEGEEVKKGQKLATIDIASAASKLLEVKENLEEVEDDIEDLSDDADTEGTTEYLEAKVLYGQQEELEELEDTLEKLMDKKAITAASAGVVQTIYVSEGEETTQSSSESNNSSGTSSAGTSTGTLSVKSSSSSQNSGIMLLSTDGTGESSETEKSTEENTASDAKTLISECSIDLNAPVTGEKPQTQLSESSFFTGTVTWNCSTEVFQADTVYTATVTLTAKEGYEFSENIIPTVSGADVVSQTAESDAGDSILKIKAKFAKTAAKETESSTGDQTDSSASGNTTGKSSAGESTAGTGKSQGSTSGGTVQGSVSAGGSGSSGSSTASTSDSSDTEYSIYETPAFSIADGEQAAVSIQVDEQDILSVEKGQTATVTLDAVEGEEFEGTITKVSSSATEGSSSVKYPVEITLEKTEDMMLGMSASATISISEAENAVLIPVSALQEKGDSSFVYTEKDEDGNLSGEVEVETGLSDGSQVEITEGLKEGDTVYYMKSESTDSTGAESGMGMPGGGKAPSGGEAPSGGGFGNRGGGPGGTE